MAVRELKDHLVLRDVHPRSGVSECQREGRANRADVRLDPKSLIHSAAPDGKGTRADSWDRRTGPVCSYQLGRVPTSSRLVNHCPQYKCCQVYRRLNSAQVADSRSNCSGIPRFLLVLRSHLSALQSSQDRADQHRDKDGHQKPDQQYHKQSRHHRYLSGTLPSSESVAVRW